VGIVNILTPTEPYTPGDKDLAELQWQKDSAWFLDPLLKASYPEKAWAAYGNLVPDVKPGDMALISQRLDYLGVNFYFRGIVSRDGKVPPVAGSEYTDMNWEVHPDSLRILLERLHKDYQLPPIYITENGAAYVDEVSADGKVHDAHRLNYIAQHLKQLRQAMSEGINVQGYFVWSLLDNFEWAFGRSKRFGIVRTDYETQKRIIKDSGLWYQQLIKDNGFDLAELKTPANATR
jgi:beta-glucosidase